MKLTQLNNISGKNIFYNERFFPYSNLIYFSIPKPLLSNSSDKFISKGRGVFCENNSWCSVYVLSLYVGCRTSCNTNRFIMFKCYFDEFIHIIIEFHFVFSSTSNNI